MKLKDSSISLSDLKPQLLLALYIVDQVMYENGGEAIITSANDASHSKTSLHYCGAAVDIRSKIFDNKESVLRQCKQALGNSPDIDMILEGKNTLNEHYHLEYQPKRR